MSTYSLILTKYSLTQKYDPENNFKIDFFLKKKKILEILAFSFDLFSSFLNDLRDRTVLFSNTLDVSID